MESDQVIDPATGYLRVQLIVKGKATDLWQSIRQGEVVGYFDIKGTPFALPEVYEMRVLANAVLPAMTDKPAGG